MLKTKIGENVTDTDGQVDLSLAGNVLESDAMSQVFDKFLDDGTLVINQVTVIDLPDGVAIAGSSGNSVFANMTVSANFTVENEEAICVVTASPEENWSFASSFSALDDTFLPLLEFADATLFLASKDISNTILTGLSFKGSLQLSDQLSVIAWLLEDVDLIELNGQIDFQDDVPLITLSKRLGGVALGFFELPFVLFQVTTAASSDPFSEVEAAFGLQSEIAFGSGSIPIGAMLFPYSRSAKFIANFTSAVDSALDALSDLTNGVDLAGLLPSDLELADKLSLKDLVLSIKLPRTRQEKVKLESVELGVESGKEPWVLVPDTISIENLRLNFRVDNIMEPKKNPSMKLLGEIGLG